MIEFEVLAMKADTDELYCCRLKTLELVQRLNLILN